MRGQAQRRWVVAARLRSGLAVALLAGLVTLAGTGFLPAAGSAALPELAEAGGAADSPAPAATQNAPEVVPPDQSEGSAPDAAEGSVPDQGGAGKRSGRDFSHTPILSDRWGFSLGGYIIDFETEAAVGSGGLLGGFIRFEEKLGLDEDKSVFRVDSFYRFNHRHGIEVGYWQLKRDGTATLEAEIDFEGITYIAAEVRSRWDTSWLKLAWRFSLINTERGEAGVGVGLNTYDWDLGLEGKAIIEDGQGGTTIETVVTSSHIVAPIPSLTIFLNYAITPRFLFRVRGDLLDLEVGEFDGKVLDLQVGFEWYFTHRVGIGGSFNSTDINLKVGGDNPYRIDYEQSGLYAYMSFVFGRRPAASVPGSVKR